MKKTISILALILSVSAAAFADLPVNDSHANGKKRIETTLQIRIDKEANEARLLIPRNQLRQLRAELEALDEGSDDSAAAFIDVSRTQTIASGLLLSLAFVVGGIWFVRSGRKPGKTTATLIVGSLILASGAFATYVYANAGPPPRTSIDGTIFTPVVHFHKTAWGKVKLESSTTEKNVILIVPDKEDK